MARDFVEMELHRLGAGVGQGERSAELPELGVLWSSAGEQFERFKAIDEINQRYDLGFVRHSGSYRSGVY
jgi:hypothetical protein